MRGGECPRCHQAVRITKDNKLYQHQNPYGSWCPYSGVTREDAQNRITSLARMLLDSGLTKNPETGQWEKTK